MAPIPFVVGQWVRGERFYGRTALIEEILDGPRNSIWLLGTRRIGKTSLLKQIEYIADKSQDPRYFPIFWDFQGAEVPDELHGNFAEALLDADERLERIGIDLSEVEADDLFVSLTNLRRRLRARNLGLMLLCDEVEELIKLHRKAPSLLRKLRHALQSHDDVRSVLASTIRLWSLADHREDTSPFLHGFTPPLYIDRLADDEARSLVLQSHLEARERPRFEDETIAAILERCDNHPYLVQLVCKRYLEIGELEEAIEHVATDRMVSYFFSVDFEMLSEAERESLRIIASASGASAGTIRGTMPQGPDSFDGSLRRLEHLGFVRRDPDQRYVLSNYFFHRWLREPEEHAPPSATVDEPLVPVAQSAVVRTQAAIPETQADVPGGGLFAELKQRNVIRVGLAYAAAAWVLLQVGDIFFNLLDVPRWAGKLLITLLALGLPIALILAWAFELTPEGLKREEEVVRTRGGSRRSHRVLDLIIIAVLALAVALLLLDKFG